MKRIRKPVHGVYLLDKPLGLSSNGAVQKVKWLFAAEKAGHTGTLDPLATGLLPVLLGEATKFSQGLLDADKTYEAVVQLGVQTTTGDLEGEVLNRHAVDVTVAGFAEKLRQIEAQFTGHLQQTPPMFSALKHEGRPLYEYARAGITIDRLARAVEIKNLDLDICTEPEFVNCIKLIAKVSKGTYIRTLAEDIGLALGCGGSLLSLRRTAISGNFGCFDIADAHQVNEEDAAGEELDGNMEDLLPCDVMLQHLPVITLNAEAEILVCNGGRLNLIAAGWTGGDAEQMRMQSETGAFLGLASGLNNKLQPLRLAKF